ncbi:hypothetical protein HKX48_001562 [Thoreauomyces humboldtii]|nr:hypothetical protein HKX48_001562 [Thoreauomyces humboldtii]
MAAPAWAAPIALAAPNVAQRQTNRGNQSQSFLKIALGRIELYDGAPDLLTVDVYIQAHKAYYTQQITFNAFGFTFFDYAETIPMSLTPELHAWHNGKVAEFTAMAGYPGPALPAGFTAKDVSDRLVNLNAVAIRLNCAANEKSISDHQAIDAVRAAYNARNFTDANLVARSAQLSNLALAAFNPTAAEVEDEEAEETVAAVSAAMALHTVCTLPSQLPPVAATSCPKTPVVPRTPMAPRAPRTPSTRGSFQQPGTPSRRGNPFTPQTPACRSTFTTANYPTPSRTPAAASAICYRCGRQGHYARNCNAKTDVEGNVMYSTSLFYYDAPTDPFEDVEFHEEDPTYDISDSSINAYQRAEEENTGEDEEGGPTHDDGPVFADFHDGCA